MKSKAPVKNFLVDHALSNPVSFHMPGHKGSEIYKRYGYDDFLKHFMDCDVTEIKGADNLFQAEGILDDSQKSYANLYGVDKSYLLINGTSGGIIASILATVPAGKKLIMARNSHKSVFNALTLAGAGPIYAYPKIIEKYGISGEISVEEIEKLLEDNPDAAAVILPSPNYYGICSDIDAIAKVVHKYDKVLIVDQAHGAHLKLFNKFGIGNFPKSAEECGADITINSIHKTLASFTQSAVLNLNSTRVSKDDLEDKLQCIESTSPSYILMASLDINARILLDHGYELMNEWNDNLNYFYEKAGEIKGLQLVEKINSMDFSKININFTKLGITGAELEKLLLKHKIYIELYTGDLVMCMTGIGNSRADMKALLKALGEISESSAKSKADIKTINTAQHSPAFKKSEIHEIPVDKIRVPLLESEGLICASSVIPYPPGIPLVCPGEKFEKDKIEYLKELLDGKHKIIGINEFDEVTAGKK